MTSIESEVRERLDAYTNAFSSKDVSSILPFYMANEVISFHEYPNGNDKPLKTQSAFNGGIFASLMRLKAPMSIGLGMVFRKLAKENYASSTIEVFSVKSDAPDRARAHVHFDRITASGAIYETHHGVYALTRVAGSWFITEAWIFDNKTPPPPALGL